MTDKKLTPDQKKLLKAKLEPQHVSEREAWKGGPKLSYIEGWHAKAEANRIFGFDGWSAETLVMDCASTQNYEKPGYGNKPAVQMIEIGYIAKVRVYAGGVYRDGTGFGTGQGKRMAEAHESAAKEAETDAFKRAVSSFGNVFGLALYDKTKANVGINTNSKADSKDDYSRIDAAISDCETVEAMEALWRKEKPVIERLPMDWQSHLVESASHRKEQIFNKQAAA